MATTHNGTIGLSVLCLRWWRHPNYFHDGSRTILLSLVLPPLPLLFSSLAMWPSVSLTASLTSCRVRVRVMTTTYISWQIILPISPSGLPGVFVMTRSAAPRQKLYSTRRNNNMTSQNAIRPLTPHTNTGTSYEDLGEGSPVCGHGSRSFQWLKRFVELYSWHKTF